MRMKKPYGKILRALSLFAMIANAGLCAAGEPPRVVPLRAPKLTVGVTVLNQHGTLGKSDDIAIVQPVLSDPDQRVGFMCTDTGHFHLTAGEDRASATPRMIFVYVANDSFATYDGNVSDNSLFCIDGETARANPPWRVRRGGILNASGPFYLTYGFRLYAAVGE